MPTWLNGLLTAIASGVATGVATYSSQPGQTSWTHVGISAGVGALVGVINWFREPPSQRGF